MDNKKRMRKVSNPKFIKIDDTKRKKTSESSTRRVRKFHDRHIISFDHMNSFPNLEEYHRLQTRTHDPSVLQDDLEDSELTELDFAIAFVDKLPISLTMMNFRNMFRSYGPVKEVHLRWMLGSNELKGYVRFPKMKYLSFATDANGILCKNNYIKVNANGWNDLTNCTGKHEVLAGNIPPICTVEHMKSLFERYGEVRSVKLYWKTWLLHMEAYICFPETDCAIQALALNGYNYGYSPLKMTLLRPDDHNGKGDSEFGKSVEPQPQGPISVFVSNFPNGTRFSELKNFFESCGPVQHVQIVGNKRCAMVYFKDAESVQNALELHNELFNGKSIMVKLSEDRKNPVPREELEFKIIQQRHVKSREIMRKYDNNTERENNTYFQEATDDVNETPQNQSDEESLLSPPSQKIQKYMERKNYVTKKERKKTLTETAKSKKHLFPRTVRKDKVKKRTLKMQTSD